MEKVDQNKSAKSARKTISACEKLETDVTAGQGR